MAESVSKLRGQLLELTGVDIMLNDSTFKSTYQIIEELAGVWDRLTDVTQANVLALIGGKRNANNISALLTNWKDAAAAAETAATSAGSALEENQKFLDSITGKLTQLKAAIENISKDIFDNSMIKGAIDALRILVGLLDRIVKYAGPLGSIGGVMLTLGQVSNRTKDFFSFLPKISAQMDKTTQKMQLMFNGKAVREYITGLKTGFGDFFRSVSENWTTAREGGQSFAKSLLTVIKNTDMAKVSQLAYTVTVKAAAAALQVMANVAIAAIATLVIRGITALSDRIAKVREEAQKAKEETISHAREQSKAVADVLTEYAKLGDQLSEGAISENEFTTQGRALLDTLRDQGETVEGLIKKYGGLTEAINGATLAQLQEAETGLRIAQGEARKSTLDAFSERSLRIESKSSNYGMASRALRDAMMGVLSDNGAAFVDIGGTGSFWDKMWTGTLTFRDRIDTSTREGQEKYIERLRAILNELSEIKGADTTDIYTAIGAELNKRTQALEAEIKAEQELQSNLVMQMRLMDTNANGVPKTLDEYKAMRERLVDMAVASTSFEGTRKEIEGIVDSVLAADAAISHFALEVAESHGLGISAQVVEARDGLIDLKDGIEEIQKHYDAYDKAVKDMAANEGKGGIGAATYDAMKELISAGEDINDYLYEEEGVLKLDTLAWLARTHAIKDQRVEDLRTYVDLLKEENEHLAESVDYNTDGDAQKASAQIAENMAAIEEAERQILVYNAEMRQGGKADYTDLFDVSDVSKTLDEVEAKYKSLQEYRNKYADAVSDAVEEAVDGIDEMPDKLGNVLLKMRQVIDASKLTAAGWDDAGNGIATLFTTTYSAGTKYNPNNPNEGHNYPYNKDVVINVTPILPNGDVLSPYDLETYLDGIIAESAKTGKSIIELDAAENGGLGVVMTVDAITGSLDEAYEAAGLFAERLHELQEEYYTGQRAGSAGTGIVLSTQEQLKQANEDLKELAKDYPEVMALWNNYDTSTMEGMLALTDAVMEGLEEARTKAIDTKIALVDAAIEDEGIDAETRQRLLGMLAFLYELRDAAKDATKSVDYDSIGNASKAISKAVESISALRSGEDVDVLSMLDNVTEMAKSAGWELSSFFTFMDGSFTFNEERIKQWAYAYIDSIDEATGITDEMKDALKELVKAESEAQTTAEKMAKAHEQAMGAASVSGTHGGYTQLTYEGFQSLIEIDRRYASAIEYQNGVLVLNKDKHAEVTQKILEETKASAELGKQNILLSEEYQNLVKAFKSGNIGYDDLKRLSDLEMQIQGFNVLTHEIDAASSAYARWVNRKGDDGMDRYTQAMSAYKLISDTLNDSKSEYYGRVGREEFGQAVDFVIGEHVEVNTPEFKRGMELAKRYLTEGAEGAAKFYDDLVSKGILDSTTGTLNSTIEEISTKLGLSEEMVRTMIDRLNEYQTEGHKITVVEPEVSDESESLLDDVTQALATAQETLTTINDTPLEIGTSNTVSNLKSVYDWLGQIAARITTVNKMSVNVNSTTSSSSSSSSSSGSSSIWSTIYQGLFGASNATGTGNAKGGKTLVGELGMETVIDPKKGIWYTVGEHGAEFVDMPEGAIVFNALQTSELFGRNKTGGRGKALAGGTNSLLQLAAGLVTAVAGVVTGVRSLTSTGTQKPTTTSTSDKASSAGVSKPKTTSSGSSSSSSSSSGGSSASESVDVVEAMAKAFEELNKQLEHLIAHQKHLYDEGQHALDFDKMAASLTQQARIYRTMMENAQNAVSRMLAQGASDTDENLQKVEEAAWSAYNSMNDMLNQLNQLYVTGLNEKIDGIQSAFSNLKTAAEEFNSAGGITVDTFQSLVNNGIQYLSLLENENGQFVINRENIDRLIAAEKEQLAVESAMSYVRQLRVALENRETNLVENLVGLTNALSSSTWDAVYAQAAMLRTAGLTDAQFARVIKNIDALRAISRSVVTDIGKAASDIKESYQDSLDALDDILKKTEDLIKYETDQHIDAIKDEVAAYREIVDLKKQSLKATKDEDEYQKNIAEKVQSVAQLQAKIDMLALDDSREAQSQRMKMIEDLKKAQEELSDLQGDRAYEIQTEALDKMADDYEASRQDEIDALEKSLSSQEKLYQAAMQRLANGWDRLYNDLIVWNTEAGSSLNNEITENWKKAAEAVRQYGTYARAATTLRERVEAASSSGTVASDVVGIGGLSDVSALAAYGASHYQPLATSQTIATLPDGSSASGRGGGVLQVMQDRWNVRTGPSTDNKIIGLAKPGESFTLTGGRKEDWYEIWYNGQRAWINGGGSKIISTYHEGGIVGMPGTNGDNEVMAVLKKGEMVITEKSRKALYKIIDFQETLAERLGTMIGQIGLPRGQAVPALAGTIGAAAGTNNMNYSPVFNVSVAYSGNASDDDARAFGEKIAQTAMDKLYDGFVRRGIGGVFGGKLKQ